MHQVHASHEPQPPSTISFLFPKLKNKRRRLKHLPWPASVKSIFTLKKENSQVPSDSPADKLVAQPADIIELRKSSGFGNT